MKRVPVKSRIITAIEYDRVQEKLDIHFRNGETRHLLNVPHTIVKKLVAADSPGNFYLSSVRGLYPRA
ncbi:KTSC domain-containing protein [Rhizobium sp. BK251]|uniref:KTSC domain-containing protein n=1 Tax=Rhizobium sp. BK251 TaxID=2512125 RepID=UPI0010D784C5|nr:KTSC domain-containing protein [Rhizobium sp. BK251]TCL70591.1 KTSC domain-containing protein [Rhizobium sp. BK251]